MLSLAIVGLMVLHGLRLCRSMLRIETTCCFPRPACPPEIQASFGAVEEAMGELMFFAVWVILRIWEDHRAIAWGPRGSIDRR